MGAGSVPSDPASARVASFLSSVRQAAGEEWATSGGAVAERILGAEGVEAYRDAFLDAHAASALDAEVGRLTQELRERGSGEVSKSKGGVKRWRVRKVSDDDDTSDCSAVQRTLVERCVRPGKPELPFAPGRHDTGGGRCVVPAFVDGPTCGRLVAATTVALGRGFRRRGQSSVGIGPSLAERLAGVEGKGGSLAEMYLVVERMRRRVAEVFGAVLADVKISDAQIARLEPFDPEAEPADGWDVGAVRGDRFCYWRPHIDQVSVGNFEWTSLLYLTRHDEDFEGGRFVMHDEGEDLVLLPDRGTLVAFPSGRESVHEVERVHSGRRFALTAWFTRREDAYDGAPPEHVELLRWAALAVDAQDRSEDPLPPPTCARRERKLFRQPEMALLSAALCTLPANDQLLADLVVAKQKGEPGAVHRCLCKVLGGNPGEVHEWHSESLWAPEGAEVSSGADGEVVVRALLQNRVPAAAALLRQLLPAPPPDPAQDDDPFGGCFD
eukprot:Hpha_TRINITY_DN22276_c0_g1::TRINITY_DN22276_c0_g1_i1::g.167232::m.167232